VREQWPELKLEDLLEEPPEEPCSANKKNAVNKNYKK
jgi:hypothetical protein